MVLYYSHIFCKLYEAMSILLFPEVKSPQLGLAMILAIRIYYYCHK